MNGKNVEGSGRGPLEILSRNLYAGIKDEQETHQVKVAGVSVEIRAKHLPNTRVTAVLTRLVSG
jgi:hypothetical protein